MQHGAPDRPSRRQILLGLLPITAIVIVIVIIELLDL
jgi:hypothetical protein